MKFKALTYLTFFFLLLVINSVQSQNLLTISGTVKQIKNSKPIEFATVLILETKSKTYTDEEGNYTIVLPKAGSYTLMVQSTGLKTYQHKFSITSSSIKKRVYLDVLTIKGKTLEITSERKVQKISRYTMTVKDLKTVPGSFGDSFNALTSLPGIIKTQGFVGPLVIRGFNPQANKYLIDDIPIQDPQHFFGLHSIINNDLIREIDVFASSYNATLKGQSGPIVRINTIDEVKELGGNAEVNILSANALLKAPLGEGLPRQGVEQSADGSAKKVKTNNGYWVGSGRISYFGIFLPPIIKALTDTKLNRLPQYFDFQFKGKHYLNADHALTMLVVGTRDQWVFQNTLTEAEQEKAIEDGADPLLSDIDFTTDLLTINTGFSHTYKPNKKILNRLTLYNITTDHSRVINITKSSWLNNIYTNTQPITLGLKESSEILLFDDAINFKTGLEYKFYHFKIDSRTLIPKGDNLQNSAGGSVDLADASAFNITELKTSINFHELGAYISPEFQWGGLLFEPGVRFDALSQINTYTIDPRARLAYEFETETTVSLAGGQYSGFSQVNTNYFVTVPSMSIAGDYLKPWRSLHRSVGVEQKFFSLFSIKVEGFYNTTEDMLSTYTHCQDSNGNITNDIPNSDYTCSNGSQWRPGYIGAKSKNYGAELLLKKNRKEGKSDFFGWVSYTYAKSFTKTGLPAAIAKDRHDKWIIAQWDREHVLKLVLGYTHKNHTITGKFQYLSSIPYTPITGSTIDPSNPNRHVPIYAGQNGVGEENSGRFQASHQLDLRYSYQKNHEWGYITWYVEALNVYNHQAQDQLEWKYNQAYSPGLNPTITSNPLSFIIPNFGVEVKF